MPVKLEYPMQKYFVLQKLNMRLSTKHFIKSPDSFIDIKPHLNSLKFLYSFFYVFTHNLCDSWRLYLVKSWWRIWHEAVLLWTCNYKLSEPSETLTLWKFFKDKVFFLFALKLAMKLLEVFCILKVNEIPYASFD